MVSGQTRSELTARSNSCALSELVFFCFSINELSTAPRVISSYMDDKKLKVEEEEGSMWSGAN